MSSRSTISGSNCSEEVLMMMSPAALASCTRRICSTIEPPVLPRRMTPTASRTEATLTMAKSAIGGSTRTQRCDCHVTSAGVLPSSSWHVASRELPTSSCWQLQRSAPLTSVVAGSAGAAAGGGAPLGSGGRLLGAAGAAEAPAGPARLDRSPTRLPSGRMS